MLDRQPVVAVADMERGLNGMAARPRDDHPPQRPQDQPLVPGQIGPDARLAVKGFVVDQHVQRSITRAHLTAIANELQ